MKPIIVANTARIRKGKPVLLVTATRADSFKAAPNAKWQVVGGSERGEWPRWQHGQAVQAVSHYNAHQFAVGDVVEIRGVTGEVVAHAELTRITMVEPERFTDADFAEMQYSSRKAYMADWGEALGDHVWSYRVRYLTEEALGKELGDAGPG